MSLSEQLFRVLLTAATSRRISQPLGDNADTDSRSPDREICPFVMKPTVTGYTSWMMRPWRRPQMGTREKCVVILPNASRLLMKRARFICTAQGRRKWVPRSLWPATSDSLFLVAFSVPWRTNIWSSPHQWQKEGPIWDYKRCQTLVIATKPRLHAGKYWSVAVGLVDKSYIMNRYQRAKLSPQHCNRSSWDAYSMHWSKRQHWLIAP